ncbi:hypothetical protein [Actinomadura madurae]|uniref:hypothetical protein n=1 Tax=Actinomadura madurae TaxID=1993 RepID=UPI0020D23CAA|nr:hypothetical protein [Actinomadura madurae]MCQ0009651.1 hypothetical protein [Actinomadura madurae]
MSTTHEQETGGVTGTKDKDYNLVWFVEQCLSNALRLETYIADAERAGRQRAGRPVPPGPDREPEGCRAGQGLPASPHDRMTPVDADVHARGVR